MSVVKKCRVCFKAATLENSTGFFCSAHAPALSTYIDGEAPAEPAMPLDTPEIDIKEYEHGAGAPLTVLTNVRMLKAKEKRADKERDVFISRCVQAVQGATLAVVVTFDEAGTLSLAYMTSGGKLVVLGLLDLAADAVRRGDVQ